MTGTPTKKVRGRRRWASSTWPTENRGRTTCVAAFCTAQNRLRVSPKAWKKGSSARKVSAPSWSRCIQAMAWLALARRFVCVSMAALGAPVVPPVCSSTARSSPPGRGHDAGSRGAPATSLSQERTPAGRRRAFIDERVRRARATGRRRAARSRAGIAADRSTENTVRPASGSTAESGPPAAVEAGSRTSSTPFSQAMTTRAPWRSSWSRTSCAGASGLCSATTAPSRSAP